MQGWLHPGPRPTVTRIIQVRNPAEIYDRYNRYK